MSSKSVSIIESSFITQNKGLLNNKEDLKEHNNNNNNNENNDSPDNNGSPGKEPLVIPNSFIASSELKANIVQSNTKIDNAKKLRKNIKMKTPVKKTKPKLFKGNKITRISKQELNNEPVDDCWVILQSIKPEFHSVRLSKKYFKDCYIGRNERNYLQINSELISSLHCKIFYVRNNI